MNTETMFSSKTDNWATPIDFFRKLNEEFHFDLDPCADEYNHKCEKYFTKEIDGLLQDWGGIVFSATLPMEKKSRSGFKKLRKKPRNRTQLLLCSSRQEPILFTFTSIFTERTQKYDLSKVGLNSETARQVRRFLRWL